MTSIVIGIDYCWNGWLDKFYPRYVGPGYRGTFHARRKRGTHEIYIIDFTTELDVVRLVKKETKSETNKHRN